MVFGDSKHIMIITSVIEKDDITHSKVRITINDKHKKILNANKEVLLRWYGAEYSLLIFLNNGF